MYDSKIRFRPTAFLLAAAVAAALGPALVHAEEKVTLCHVPPGNATNPRTIEVGASAVGAHFGHGDALGECPNGFGPCGDGVVQGSEGCDPPDFADRTCVDVLGEGATGEPACTETCELALGSCQLCGNGMREGAEQCDDGNDNPFDGCDQCILVDITPD